MVFSISSHLLVCSDKVISFTLVILYACIYWGPDMHRTGKRKKDLKIQKTGCEQWRLYLHLQIMCENILHFEFCDVTEVARPNRANYVIPPTLLRTQCK